MATIKGFICAECGKKKSIHLLSHESREEAGTNDPAEALQLLDPEDRICTGCAIEDDVNDLGGAPGWGDYDTYVEQNFGTIVDPGLWSAIQQNY